MDTYTSSFTDDKIYSKGEPLKFPLAVQSDSDDRKELLETKFHEEWTSSDRSQNSQKDEQKHKKFDKNKSVQGVLIIVDNVDNNSNEIAAINKSSE